MDDTRALHPSCAPVGLSESHQHSPVPPSPARQLSPPNDGSHVLPTAPQFPAPIPASRCGAFSAMHIPNQPASASVAHSAFKPPCLVQTAVSPTADPLFGAHPHAAE